MAKELPYFRFTVSEWLNDDISMEDYTTKGVFIDVCSFYWFRDCSVDVTLLEKRFISSLTTITLLVELNIIKYSNKGQVSINFLDVQFDLLSEKRKKYVEAGKKGGLKKSSNAKATLKQRSSYKDKDKDKDNDNNKEKSIVDIVARKLAFTNQLKEFRVSYTENMITDFFEYWTEHGINDKKMRFEKERTFGMSRRLKTWDRNNFNNSTKKEKNFTTNR